MMIAELLHLKPFILHEETGLVPIPHGWRLKHDCGDRGRLLIVDDTVASGRSLERALAVNIPREHLVAAVYVNPEQAHRVQLVGRLLPIPHYLEWNLFNSVYTSSIASDIDGILCPDPLPGWSDCQYERYLQTAPIRQRPVRAVLPLIVTGRRRRYRVHTEQWLRRHGISYDRLVFPKDDVEWANPGLLKADEYRRSGASLFVESDPVQAHLIADITKKRVICPASNEVLN
jgi:hypothetical protein